MTLHEKASSDSKGAGRERPSRTSRSSPPIRTANSSAKTEPRKLQFAVDEDTYRRLVESKEMQGDRTLAQAFRRMIRMWHFLSVKQSEGWDVLLELEKDGHAEKVILV